MATLCILIADGLIGGLSGVIPVYYSDELCGAEFSAKMRKLETLSKIPQSPACVVVGTGEMDGGMYGF